MKYSLSDVGWFTPFKLGLLKERLNAVGIRWLLFAGVAAYCYGSKRRVSDIDVLVFDQDFEKAERAMGKMDGVELCKGKFKKIGKKEYYLGLNEEMFTHKQTRTFFGVEVNLISVEDNILFKAISQRGKEQEKFDLEDIIAMAKSEKINVDYLKRRIKILGAARRVNPVLKKLGVL